MAEHIVNAHGSADSIAHQQSLPVVHAKPSHINPISLAVLPDRCHTDGVVASIVEGPTDDVSSSV
jgi:hypothetical protein